mgnify:CR=1 FL=1
MIDGARGPLIGHDDEALLALYLQQPGDVLKYLRELNVVHNSSFAKLTVAIASPGEPRLIQLDDISERREETEIPHVGRQPKHSLLDITLRLNL